MAWADEVDEDTDEETLAEEHVWELVEAVQLWDGDTCVEFSWRCTKCGAGGSTSSTVCLPEGYEVVGGPCRS